MLMMEGNNCLPILAAEINAGHEAHELQLLPKYGAACRAIAEARSLDEVKSIRDQASAMAACAHQAGNKHLEADAAEIRERAERRLGEMIAAQREAGSLNPGTRLIGGGTGAGGFVADPPAHLPTLKELGIDKHLADRARKAADLPPDIYEAALAVRLRQIRTKSRVRSLLSIAHKMQADARRAETQAAAMAAMPALITDRYRLFHDDMATTDKIGPESVDHIITDAPFTREYLSCFEHLARRASEWLKPGGSLVVMCGQFYLPEGITALAKSRLMYRWTFRCEMKGGPCPAIYERHIFPRWKPISWYVKGNCDDLEWTDDVIEGGNHDDRRYHRWGQSEAQFEEIVRRASLPGQIILDPFCGGGTTGVAVLRLGRQFSGIDIDEKSIAVTAERLKQIEHKAHQSASFQPDGSECSRQRRPGSGAFARTTRHD